MKGDDAHQPAANPEAKGFHGSGCWAGGVEFRVEGLRNLEGLNNIEGYRLQSLGDT